MKPFFCLLCLAISLTMSSQAAVKGENVEYKVGDKTFKGYIAYDDQVTGKRPAILVVHEYWGQNAYARHRADMLAEIGYTAMALDMYGDGINATDPKQASSLSQAVVKDPEAAKERFLVAMNLLKGFRYTDPNSIGAIGYCFGGFIVLEMALAGVDLAGVVSFHGALPPVPVGIKPGDVKAKILICHGAADKMVTPDKVAAFREAMDEAGIKYRFIAYEGATHVFTNPMADEIAKKFNLPIAYNPKADKESWDAMKSFFKNLFGI